MFIKIVVFDLGGVLVRIHHEISSALSAAGWVGEPVDLDDVAAFNRANCDYQSGRLSLEEFVDHMYEQLQRRVSKRLLRSAHDSILRSEYVGARKVVEDLRSMGVATAVLSNTCASHWERLSTFEAVSTASQDHCFLSFEMGLVKPDGSIYEKVEQALAVQPFEIAFLDDSAGNIEAAKERGWQATHVQSAREGCGPLREALRGFGFSV